MKRKLLIAFLVIVALGVALPFAPVAFMKGPMERALSRGLGRRVEIDSVSLTLFAGPGFSLSGVTIHEDPRAGIEPFAYANTLDATLDAVALMEGSVQFSSLHFNDATFNLVKPDQEVWNFQMLLDTSPGIPLPSLKMRGGRVNFKFGDTKSVVFFDDADLDIAARDNGNLELRFSGVPARTDRSVQGFAHFFVRGTSARGQLNYRVELEPSALDSVARMFSADVSDLRGTAMLDAQISGPSQHLDVKGLARFGDGGKLRLDYKGTLDLASQTLQLETVLPSELRTNVRVGVDRLLSRPQWNVAAEMDAMPLDALLNIARQVGAPVPVGKGTVTGNPGYSATAGFSGNVEVRDAEIGALKFPTATVFLKKETILAGPVTVNFGEKDTAEVQATYQSGDGGGTELRVSTRHMEVEDMRALGLRNAPLFDRLKGGSWRGALKFEKPVDTAGAWAGDAEIANSGIAIDGVAAPVELQSAAVNLKPERVAITRIRAKAGAIPISGEYRWDTDPAVPQEFRLEAGAAEIAEIERLLTPALVRGGGGLSRALGIGGPIVVPEWLTSRKVKGVIVLDALKVGGVTLSGPATFGWMGTTATIAATNMKAAAALASGELRVDLSGVAPRYQFTGRARNINYKGGAIDFDGKAEAEGTGGPLLASIKVEGTLRGRSITIPPDPEYRQVSGQLSLHMTPAGAQWTVAELQVERGVELLSGEATGQPDGKVVVKLGRAP